MIAFVSGKLAGRSGDSCIIEAGGIGYRIYTSVTTLEKLPPDGEEVRMLTHYHVREDAALLYGFPTREELSTFEMLITISGVGPKAALSLLSSLSPAGFSTAVVTGDAQTLARAPGIGLKTAQRIIVELGDKLRKTRILTGSESGAVPAPVGSVQPGGSGSAAEAVDALMVLGYTAAEASRAVGDIFEDHLGTEALIMKALRRVARV